MNGLRTARVCGWLIVLVVAALAQSSSPECDKVDVGGHRLFYCTRGEGSPTVVMDADLRDNSRAWRSVFPRVANFTRTVIYDRAGRGRSDPGPPPRTSREIARELHTLLKRAGIPGPYVLVGHGFGGWNMRMFASEYPGDVAGLVLVDSPHEDFEKERRRILSPPERRQVEKTEQNERRHLPPGIRREYEALSASRNQLKFLSRLPPVPLVVISARHHGFLPRQKAGQLERLWRQQQRALTRLSPSSRFIVAKKSRHYVQFDEPAVVVRAIRSVVEAARTGRPLE